MATSFSTLGFQVHDSDDLQQLLGRVGPTMGLAAQRGDTMLLVWVDESGAGLAMTGGNQQGLVPFYSGAQAALAADIAVASGTVATITLVSEAGQIEGRANVDLAEWAFVPTDATGPFPATLTLMATDCSIFPDAEAFDRSPESYLDPSTADEPRPEGYPDDQPWPLKFGVGSFLPVGMLVPDGEPSSEALLNAVVEASHTATNTVTGGAFHVVQSRFGNSVVWVCLDAAEVALPEPGAVIRAHGLLSAALPEMMAQQPVQ